MSNNKEEKSQEQEFQNPIDETHTTDTPNTLPYAHTRGSAVVKPNEKGHIKATALTAMEQQTDKQLAQLYEQMQTLANQAKEINKRTEISKQIYEAEMNFQPVIGHTYHVYIRKNGKYVLSMVSPEEWGKNPPYIYVAKASLLADHTWEVLEYNWNNFEEESEI